MMCSVTRLVHQEKEDHHDDGDEWHGWSGTPIVRSFD